MATSNVTIKGKAPSNGSNKGPGKGEFNDVGGLANLEIAQNNRPENININSDNTIVRDDLNSLPIINESKIQMNREVYSKKKFNDAIGNSFEELLRKEDTFTPEQFFKLYDTLFFDIPRFGTDSHDTLRRRSQEFVGRSNPEESNIISNLTDRILELEQQLLLANEVVPEHPFYKNGTLVKQLDSARVYYLDKGFKRLVDSADSSWYNSLRDILGVEGTPLEAPVTSLAQIPSPNSSARNLTRANQHEQTVIQNSNLIFYSDSDSFAGVTVDEQVASLEVTIQNLQTQVIDAGERNQIANNIKTDAVSWLANKLRLIRVPSPLVDINVYDNIAAVREAVDNLGNRLYNYVLSEMERFIG